MDLYDFLLVTEFTTQSEENKKFLLSRTLKFFYSIGKSNKMLHSY